MITRGCFYLF